MSERPGPHPLRWLPPFLVGVSAATVAEVAATLLLYTGPGLMRSVTLILTVQAGALGVGVWNRPESGNDLVSALRRRWLLCMVVFLVATLYGASWSLLRGVGGTAVGQGLGLAFLVALPLYSCGSVLGAMSTAADELSGRVGGVGAPALFGAALGFVATGVSLPQVLTPASLLLVCLVLLSGAGLVYGSVLDARLRTHVRDRRDSSLGEVRVEDRHLPLKDRGARMLYEGRCLRRWMALEEGNDAAPWDTVVFSTLYDILHAESTEPLRVLCVGGGASTVPREAVRADPVVVVDVVERSGSVLALASEHLHTALTPEGGHRIKVDLGNPEDIVAALREPYDLVLLDTAALCPIGGIGAMTRFGWTALARAVAPGGILAVGPLSPDAESVPTPHGWTVRSFTRALPELQGLGDRNAAGAFPEETVVLTSPHFGALELPVPRGFSPRDERTLDADAPSP